MPTQSVDCREDIARIHRMIHLLLSKLEHHINDPQACDEEEIAHLWNKESDLSVLLKLSQILFKLIPVEQELSSEEGSEEHSLSQDDITILEQYVARCIKEGRTY